MLKTVVSLFGLLLPVLGYATSAHAYTINSTERGRSIRWSADVVGLRIDESFHAMLDQGESYAALAMALDAWRGYPGVPDILVTEGQATPPGHHQDKGATNTIHMLADWPYEADKLAVTVLTYEVESGRLLDADVLVNGDVNYALLSEAPDATVDSSHPQYDLAAVLTHEAGHMLGLGESDADESATMWPYAHPGDTHQRTLSTDDEAGVMVAYSGPAPEPAGGCGQANISSRHARVATVLWALLPLMLLGLRRLQPRTVVHARRAGLAVAIAAALALPAAGEDLSAPRLAEVKAISDLSDPMQLALLHDAMYDADPDVRMAVAEQLALLGHREQRQWAEHLRGDDEARVRRAAVGALDALTTAPPSVTRPTLRDASVAHPIHGRLHALTVERDRLHIGRAHRTGVERDGGLLWTRYQVTAQDGSVHELRLPGGRDGNIAQRIGQEPLPPEGAELAVMPGAHGLRAWTYHRDGTLYGGALGSDRVQL